MVEGEGGWFREGRPESETAMLARNSLDIA